MTKKRYGLIAGIAGAAFATWWMRRRRSVRGLSQMSQDRGDVIYSNSPIG